MALKLLLLFCVVATALAEKYSDKYDNVDIQEVIDNRRILVTYSNCVLDKGKCSPEGKELKENLKDAIENGCEKCTDAQKKGASTMIRHLIEKEPEIWNELTEKYDPSGKFRKVYEERVKANSVIIP